MKASHDAPPARGTVGTGPAAGLDAEWQAADQLAAVLRIWGEHAFDLDTMDAATIARQLESWARHVLVGATDGVPAPATADNPHLARRDWKGLRDFAAQLRRAEKSFVGSQVKGIRQVMGDFVQTLAALLAEDREEQQRVIDIIDGMRRVIETPSTLEVMVRETARALDLIGQIARERQRRHQGVLGELTLKMQELRGELTAAQRELALDPLTRLYNRKAFDERLIELAELSRIAGHRACLIMIDIDHFKTINDSLGHPVGDQVLVRLANCCARSFPRKTDFVARYGGEEFAILLPDTGADTARQLATRLLDAVHQLRIAHPDGDLTLTVSAGLAPLTPGLSAGEWLRRADEALYRSKHAGRDRLTLW